MCAQSGSRHFVVLGSVKAECVQKTGIGVLANGDHQPRVFATQRDHTSLESVGPISGAPGVELDLYRHVLLPKSKFQLSGPGREAHRPQRTCPTKHKAAWLILVFLDP